MKDIIIKNAVSVLSSVTEDKDLDKTAFVKLLSALILEYNLDMESILEKVSIENDFHIFVKRFQQKGLEIKDERQTYEDYTVLTKILEVYQEFVPDNSKELLELVVANPKVFKRFFWEDDADELEYNDYLLFQYILDDMEFDITLADLLIEFRTIMHVIISQKLNEDEVRIFLAKSLDHMKDYDPLKMPTNEIFQLVHKYYV